MVTDKKYFMEKDLVEQLEFLKDCVAQKWDAVILIDGVEGSGKSSFAFQIAYYLDRGFNLNKIVFTPEEFVEAVDNAAVGDFILWDEFSLAGLSTDAMTKVQGTILKKMTTIRSKRLYIGLIISWVFELRKYFAVGRTRFLIHTNVAQDGITRGKFKVWGFDSKRKLYFKGKKDYSYSVSADMRGSFPLTDGIFFDLDAYEKKKQDAIKTIDFDNHKDTKYKSQRDECIMLADDEGVPKIKIADRLGITDRGIRFIVSEGRKKKKNILGE